MSKPSKQIIDLFFEGTLDGPLLSDETKRKFYMDRLKEARAKAKADAAMIRKQQRIALKQEREAIMQRNDDLVQELFQRWKDLFERPRSTLTKARRWHLSLALEKFDPLDIDLVLQTAAADPNTRGHNKLNRPFDDIPNILRNEERIEMYLRMAQLKGTGLTASGKHSAGERI